jgi:hypothetical protein
MSELTHIRENNDDSEIDETKWFAIDGKLGYQINCYGAVKSLERKVRGRGAGLTPIKEKILKSMDNGRGYLRVTFGKYIKGDYIHRLVAQTFIPNPNNLPTVNHKDLNKKNNYYKNLEWCTYPENCTHALLNGVKSTKLTPELVNQIRALEGRVATIEICKMYSINRGHVYRIFRKTCWKTI